jgi:hypothetical protein
MSDHRDLIKRLYAPATRNTRPLRTEAADALHALVAENETLRAALAAIQHTRQSDNPAVTLWRECLTIADSALAAARGGDET